MLASPRGPLGPARHDRAGRPGRIVGGPTPARLLRSGPPELANGRGLGPDRGPRPFDPLRRRQPDQARPDSSRHRPRVGPRRGQPRGGAGAGAHHVLPGSQGDRRRSPAVGPGGRFQAERPGRRPEVQRARLVGGPDRGRNDRPGPDQPIRRPVRRGGRRLAPAQLPGAARDPEQPAAPPSGARPTRSA